MIKFLAGKAIASAVNRNLSRLGPTDLAVAYWGRGGAKKLGLTDTDTHKAGTHKNVRIICDLWSLACHPDELLGLLKDGFKLRTKDGLHAKVYLLGEYAVIGSANASTNGLGVEGNKFDFELEAAVETDDLNVIAAAKEWFEKQWRTSEPVDKALLEKVRPEWLRRKRAIMGGNTNPDSLFHRLATDPGFFSGLPISLGVFQYDEAYTQNEKTAWTKVANRYNEAERGQYGDGHYPIYLNRFKKKFAIGDSLINYWVTCKDDGTIDTFESLGGAWRILDEETVKFAGAQHKIVLAREEKQLERLRVPRKEYEDLQNILGGYFKRTSPKPFHDVLIGFSEIPNKHPDLFEAICAWSKRGRTEKAA
jgi:PLD-like domain